MKLLMLHYFFVIHQMCSISAKYEVGSYLKVVNKKSMMFKQLITAGIYKFCVVGNLSDEILSTSAVRFRYIMWQDIKMWSQHSFTYSMSENDAPPISRVLIGRHLIFHSLTSPPCCNLPRKCTPAKYKKRQKAGFPIVT